MKKYEVRTFEVETKDGKNVMKAWSESTNQTTNLVKTFDTLEEAQAFYRTVDTRIDNHGSYYESICKCIEINEYDEDNEWISGGDWWEYEMPELN